MGYIFPQLTAGEQYPICEVLYDQDQFLFQAQSARLDPNVITDEIASTVGELESVSFYS